MYFLKGALRAAADKTGRAQRRDDERRKTGLCSDGRPIYLFESPQMSEIAELGPGVRMFCMYFAW